MLNYIGLSFRPRGPKPFKDWSPDSVAIGFEGQPLPKSYVCLYRRHLMSISHREVQPCFLPHAHYSTLSSLKWSPVPRYLGGRTSDCSGRGVAKEFISTSGSPLLVNDNVVQIQPCTLNSALTQNKQMVMASIKRSCSFPLSVFFLNSENARKYLEKTQISGNLKCIDLKKLDNLRYADLHVSVHLSGQSVALGLLMQPPC